MKIITKKTPSTFMTPSQKASSALTPLAATYSASATAKHVT